MRLLRTRFSLRVMMLAISKGRSAPTSLPRRRRFDAVLKQDWPQEGQVTCHNGNTNTSVPLLTHGFTLSPTRLCRSDR
jgi:hypothetical protein